MTMMRIATRLTRSPRALLPGRGSPLCFPLLASTAFSVLFCCLGGCFFVDVSVLREFFSEAGDKVARGGEWVATKTQPRERERWWAVLCLFLGGKMSARFPVFLYERW